MFQSVARTCFRRRRLVVLVWIGLLFGAIAASSSFGGEMRNDFTMPGSPSQEAADLLERAGFAHGAGEQGQIVIAADRGVEQPEVRDAVISFLSDVRGEVADVDVSDPYADFGLISPDGRVAIAEVSFGDAELDEASELAAELTELRAATTFPDGVQVELGGDVF